MDLAVNVMVTKMEAEIIDDGIDIEDMDDIDDMEIDFFFSKCDSLDLTPKKSDSQNKITEIVELSDDEEDLIEKVVPKDKVQKAKQEDAQNKLLAIEKRAVSPPKLPVIKIPKDHANRRFQIAIQSNIDIVNNDISSVAPPTVANTVSTQAFIQTQPVINKPKLLVIDNKDQPTNSQTKHVKDIMIMQKEKNEVSNSYVPQNNELLLSLLNKRTKPLVLTPISLKEDQNNKEILEKNFLQYLKKLSETPSTSKDTLSEPPMIYEKNSNNLTPDAKQKNQTLRMQKESPETQDINEEEITTKDIEYTISSVGGFKAVHDASGAIIQMIEETTNSEDELEESQDNLKLIDKKLLAVTTVQLDDWSAILSNNSKYCSLCQTLFPSRAGLDEHQALWHPLLVPCVEEEGYYCQLCDTSFHDKTSLERHSHTHKKTTHTLTYKADFKCFVCRDWFVNQRAFHEHVNSVHMRSLSCHCGTEFPLQELLDDHIKTVHASQPNSEPKPYKSLGRDKVESSSQSNMNKPVKERRYNYLIQKTAIFECESCKANFTSYIRAQKHYRKCENNKKYKKCEYCAKSISSKLHSHQHIKGCKLKSYTVNEKELFVFSKCPKCQLHFRERLNFTIHVNNCKGPTKDYIKCCGLKFNNYEYLLHKAKHQRSHNRQYIVLKYMLDVPIKVEAEVGQQMELPKTEQKEKQEVKPRVKCHICGVVCYQLKRHMAVHSPNRPFTCNKCFYSTKRSDDLKKHKIICKGNEINAVWYECPNCDYKSKNKRGLQSHMVNQRLCCRLE